MRHLSYGAILAVALVSLYVAFGEYQELKHALAIVDQQRSEIERLTLSKEFQAGRADEAQELLSYCMGAKHK